MARSVTLLLMRQIDRADLEHGHAVAKAQVGRHGVQRTRQQRMAQRNFVGGDGIDESRYFREAPYAALT